MANEDLSATGLPHPQEIKLETGDSASDWMMLLKELGENPDPGKQRRAPAPPPAEEKVREVKLDVTPKPRPADDPASKTRSKYEEICKRSSMQMERADMLVLSSFSNIIAKVNEAGKTISVIQKRFPDLMPNHQIQAIRENLKETATVMLKEFHAMRHGRQQKKYDKRYVCKECNAVFMVPLPGDGICDECRAAKAPRSAPY